MININPNKVIYLKFKTKTLNKIQMKKNFNNNNFKF